MTLNELSNSLCKPYNLKSPYILFTTLVKQAAYIRILNLNIILINPHSKDIVEKLIHELAHYITLYKFKEKGHTHNFLFVYYELARQVKIIKADKVKRFLIKRKRKRLSLKILRAYLKVFQ